MGSGSAIPVVWLVAGSETYGLRTYVLEVARRLGAERGLRLSVVAVSDGDYFDALRAGGVEVISLGLAAFSALRGAGGRRSPARVWRELARQWRVFRAVARVLRDLQPAVIHTHTPHYHLLAAVLACWFRGRFRYVWHWHGPYIYRGLPDRLLRRLAGGSARTFAISEFVKTTLPAAMQANCLVVPNGLDTSRRPPTRGEFRRRFAIDAAAPLVGAFGNIIPRKGFGYFIDAIPQILRAYPACRFALVGDVAGGDADGESQRLRTRAAELGIADRLTFTGMLPRAADYMADFDVLVTPTIPFGSDPGEGFGLVVVEAMWAGVPVVATRLGAFPEIVEHERSGLLIPPQSADALGEAVVRLLSDKELGMRLVAGGRQRVADCFSLDRLAADLYGQYQALAARRP